MFTLAVESSVVFSLSSRVNLCSNGFFSPMWDWHTKKFREYLPWISVAFDTVSIRSLINTNHRLFHSIKVYLTSDGRYIPPEGRVHYNHPKAVDTTYIIRRPFMRGNHKPSNNFENLKVRGYPKITQTYSNHGQIVPIVPPSKPGVYKPVITPLILPADRNLLDLSSWQPGYDWDTTVYEPFADYFIDDIALFDSHQVIVWTNRAWPTRNSSHDFLRPTRWFSY